MATTNEELMNALYDKVSAEQDAYRKWLLAQRPEEILNHAYEYINREDIVGILEEEDIELTDRQCQALLKSHTPLADIYRLYEKWETGHMDDMRSVISCRANDVLHQERPKSYER